MKIINKNLVIFTIKRRKTTGTLKASFSLKKEQFSKNVNQKIKLVCKSFSFFNPYSIKLGLFYYIPLFNKLNLHRKKTKIIYNYFAFNQKFFGFKVKWNTQ